MEEKQISLTFTEILAICNALRRHKRHIEACVNSGAILGLTLPHVNNALEKVMVVLDSEW